MSLWPVDPSEIKEYLCKLWENEYPGQGCLPFAYTWKHVRIQLSEIKYGKPCRISKGKIKAIINEIKSGKSLPPLICLNGELIDGYHRYHAYKQLGTMTDYVEAYINEHQRIIGI